MTTVQDRGRFGFQSRGVPPAGPMDWSSHRLANLIVGNPAGAATLEVTLLGPEIEFDCDARLALSGAEFRVTLDGVAIPSGVSHPVRAGSTLKFGPRMRGARAYLAVNGGIDVPLVLGSRATHVISRMGGQDGRRLQDGDRLALGEVIAGIAPRKHFVEPLPDGGASLRVLMGPHEHRFGDTAVRSFFESSFVVANESDRMAYRLNGPRIAANGEGSGDELISDVLPNGGVQIPGSGQPILLMADRATTGGYPMIATVITADLPRAGQLAPGDWIRFEPCTPAVAMAALIARERRLME
jgi:antagonist of KipI